MHGVVNGVVRGRNAWRGAWAWCVGVVHGDLAERLRRPVAPLEDFDARARGDDDKLAELVKCRDDALELTIGLAAARRRLALETVVF